MSKFQRLFRIVRTILADDTFHRNLDTPVKKAVVFVNRPVIVQLVAVVLRIEFRGLCAYGHNAWWLEGANF